jgi:NodT family efflux transporter outer membrane factor (OMF) lipoprotein
VLYPAQANGSPASRAVVGRAAGALMAVLLGGCMVGPDYRPPAAPIAPEWAVSDPTRVEAGATEPERWWSVFGDPALDALVDAAYRQNLTLQAAGLRVIAAQARRGIAIGELFPQQQAAVGQAARTHQSLNVPFSTPGTRDFSTFQLGFDAAWELDFWGRFRRGIESADAALLASVADYDDVLVSLVAEVAVTYVQVRVIEDLLALARDNARLQRNGLDIATVRFEAGGTSDLDVQQATTLLEDTEADIPALEIQLRQSLDSLSVLLGVPPNDLTDILGRSSGIPAPPPSVAVGIPADLLRRRPDVRRAERQLAAQSARIGIATSDLYPRLQLVGQVGLSADQAAKLFTGDPLAASGGAQFDWPILNYGRLINAVRVEDATFQELVATYGNTVLRAQQDVVDAITGYVRGIDEVSHLERSVNGANRAVELSLIQYTSGAADYTRVLTAQQSKITADRRLTNTRGAVTSSVIALYKALGGGWEIRAGDEFVPPDVADEMKRRTWWGSMLTHDEQIDEVDAAAADRKAAEQGQRWHWWWPQW